MSNVKDNHYVPRFYLRSFTDDPSHRNGRFDFFNLKTKKHIGVIPHGSQMKERYFYKKGTDIETKLNDEFEGKHATIIKTILASQATSESLVEMILLMHFRTRAQRDDDLFFRKSMIDQHLDYLVASFKRSLPFWVRILVQVRLLKDSHIEKIVRQGAYEEYLKKTDSAEKQIKNFKRIKKEMAGLTAHILDNPHTTNLISSDSPVILLNPFLNRKKVRFGRTGMFQIGILLILPISPKKVVVCFDSDIYESPTEVSKGILTENDVKHLNELQILSGAEGVYSISLPKNIETIVSDTLNGKKSPSIVTLHLPDNYQLTYKDSGLPDVDFSFIKEKKHTDTLTLRLPYSRINGLIKY